MHKFKDPSTISPLQNMIEQIKHSTGWKDPLSDAKDAFAVHIMATGSLEQNTTGMQSELF